MNNKKIEDYTEEELRKLTEGERRKIEESICEVIYKGTNHLAPRSSERINRSLTVTQSVNVGSHHNQLPLVRNLLDAARLNLVLIIQNLKATTTNSQISRFFEKFNCRRSKIVWRNGISKKFGAIEFYTKKDKDGALYSLNKSLDASICELSKPLLLREFEQKDEKWFAKKRKRNQNIHGSSVGSSTLNTRSNRSREFRARDYTFFNNVNIGTTTSSIGESSNNNAIDGGETLKRYKIDLNITDSDSDN